MAGSLQGAPSFKRVDATVKGDPTYDEFVGTHGGTSTARLAAAWRKRFQPSHRAQGAAAAAHRTGHPTPGAAIGAPAGTTGTAPASTDHSLDGLQGFQADQVRFYDAQTKAQADQATAAYSALQTAARGDADALARRLGSLSAAAGATSFQGNTADPRVQALTGILGQDAQQRMVTASGEAIRQSSDLPTLVGLEGQSKAAALGAQRAAGRMDLIGGFQGTNAKLQSDAADRAVQTRGQNLTYLGMIGATNAKVDIANNDRLAQLRQQRAKLQNDLRIARERNDTAAINATTAAQARVDAAIARQTGSGAAGDGKDARAYANLRAKVTKDLSAAANVKQGTQAYDGTTGELLYHTDPDTGQRVPTMASQTTGGMSAKDVLTNALARGLRPADAWQVMSSIWGIGYGQKTPTAAGESVPHGVFFQWLSQRVGRARARAAVKKITGFDPMGG